MLSNPSMYSDEEEIWDLMNNLKFCTCDWEVANADLTMDYSLDIEHKLKYIEVHIDIIFGNMDFLTQMGRQMSLAASIKNCQLYVVAGGMHQVCIDRPQHVYETLVKSK